MGLKWYECVDMWLPEKRVDESLEEWSQRIEPYVELDEWTLSHGCYVRDLILGSKPEKVRREQLLVDAVMNCLHKKGVRIMHRNWADDDTLVPVPERGENEPIEEWSDRITVFIHFLHKMDSWVTYEGSQALDMTTL